MGRRNVYWDEDDVRTPARVLHLARPATGGLRAHIVEIIRGLDRRTFEPWICAPAEFNAELPIGLPPYRGQICSVGARTSPRDLLTALQFRLLAEKVGRRVPVIVHAHGIRAGWVASLSLAATNFPLVVTLHTIPPPGFFRAAALNVLSQRANQIVCVSDAIANEMRLPGAKVIPNGVDLKLYQKLDRVAGRKELGIDESAFVVGCVARLAREKGVDILASVAAKMPDVEFVVIGDGPEAESIEDVAPSNMHLLGHHDTAVPLLAAADVIVVPSRSEGQGIAALEAMAAGCALVATNVGGLPGMITNEVTGLLVPSEEVDAMVAAIQRLQSDSKLRQALGKNARDWAMQNGSSEGRLQDLQTLYLNLLRQCFPPKYS